MNALFWAHNLFRPPQWRADRAQHMVSHRPRPLTSCSYDDTYVRTYRNFLESLVDAGDSDVARQAAIGMRPHAYHAHLLRYESDSEYRQILDARLLTSETYEQIAERFATDAEVIEFYENLFFNVRDRLEHRGWIYKVIIGRRDDLVSNARGSITEAQRGYVYRLFAYHGGPLVLDALVAAIGSQARPERREQVMDWFDESLAESVRSAAATAAATVQFDSRNVIQILKQAMRQQRKGAKHTGRNAPPPVDEEQLKKIVKAMEPTLKSFRAATTKPTSDE